MTADRPRASVTIGRAALVATALLWSSNHVVARVVAEIVPLPALAFWRWAIGASLLTAIAFPTLRRQVDAIRPLAGSLVVGGLVGVGLFSYLLLGGAYLGLAVEVGIINATTPVWVAVLGLVTGREKPNGQLWLGLALAFAGTVAIIVRGDTAVLSGFGMGPGNLATLAAAMVFAWFSLRVRVWSQSIDPLSITVVTGWAAVILVFAPVYGVSLALGGAWFDRTGTSTATALAAIAFIGIGPTMLGNLFYLFGIGAVGPARAAAFLYLTPAATAGFAVVFLGEELAGYHFFGFALILAGLAVLQTIPDQRSRSSTLT